MGWQWRLCGGLGRVVRVANAVAVVVVVVLATRIIVVMATIVCMAMAAGYQHQLLLLLYCGTPMRTAYGPVYHHPLAHGACSAGPWFEPWVGHSLERTVSGVRASVTPRAAWPAARDNG